MRDHLDEQGKAGWQTPLESIISPGETWSCTTCRACVEACPVSILHIDLLIDVRRALVMKSRLEPHIAATLQKQHDTGNPFGLAKEQRLGWTAGLPAGVRAVPAVLQRSAPASALVPVDWAPCRQIVRCVPVWYVVRRFRKRDRSRRRLHSMHGNLSTIERE